MTFMVGDKVKLDPKSQHFHNMISYGYSAYTTYIVCDTAADCLKIDSSPGWYYASSFRLVNEIDYSAINKEFA